MIRRYSRGFLIFLLLAAILSPGYTQPLRCARAESPVKETAPAEEARYTPPGNLTLSHGSKGEDVRRLQERLTELGYDCGTADGIYGNGTSSAVSAFQKRNGLDPDGIAGPLTLARLFSDEAVPAPAPAEPVNVLEGGLPYLVNREHPVEENFLPADLVLMSDLCDSKLVHIKYSGTRAVRTAVEALIRMLEAARKDGIKKWQISAAYRSYKDQENMLNSKINHYLKKNTSWSRSRARSAALKTVAEPGASEHHLGLSFDINVPGASSFAGTKQCKWLHKHCWEYGFIVRYQAGKEEITGFTPEAWHIRYVGVEHSLPIRDGNLCLEEYLEAAELEITEEEN